MKLDECWIISLVLTLVIQSMVTPYHNYNCNAAHGLITIYLNLFSVLIIYVQIEWQNEPFN